MKQKLFQIAILWHPTEEQKKEGKKSEIVTQPKFILAVDEKSAGLSAAMEIPTDKKGELDQLEIAVRPF